MKDFGVIPAQGNVAAQISRENAFKQDLSAICSINQYAAAII
jgi:hypothetical protein